MYRRVVPVMNLNMSNQPLFLRWLYKILYALTFSPRRTRERARDCGPPQPSRSDGIHGPISPRCGGRNLHLSCRSAVPWMAGAIYCLGANLDTLYNGAYNVPDPGHLLLQTLWWQCGGFAQPWVRPSQLDGYLEWLDYVLDQSSVSRRWSGWGTVSNPLYCMVA